MVHKKLNGKGKGNVGEKKIFLESIVPGKGLGGRGKLSFADNIKRWWVQVIDSSMCKNSRTRYL